MGERFSWPLAAAEGAKFGEETAGVGAFVSGLVERSGEAKGILRGNADMDWPLAISLSFLLANNCALIDSANAIVSGDLGGGTGGTAGALPVGDTGAEVEPTGGFATAACFKGCSKGLAFTGSIGSEGSFLAGALGESGAGLTVADNGAAKVLGLSGSISSLALVFFIVISLLFIEGLFRIFIFKA